MLRLAYEQKKNASQISQEINGEITDTRLQVTPREVTPIIARLEREVYEKCGHVYPMHAFILEKELAKQREREKWNAEEPLRQAALEKARERLASEGKGAGPSGAAEAAGEPKKLTQADIDRRPEPQKPLTGKRKLWNKITKTANDIYWILRR